MGNKQNLFSFLDKFKKSNGKNLERNKKIFWLTFWSVFIGSSVFVAIPLWLQTLSEKLAKNSKIHIELIEKIGNSELVRHLEQKKEEIYAKALEKSKPKLRNLRNEVTSDVAHFTEQKLNWYFENIETQNVDKFLDWLYSFGTDYKIALHWFKEEKVDKLLSAKECLKGGNIKSCKNAVKASGYFESQVAKYLINPKDLENYIESEILPYHEQKLEEFRNKSYQILKAEIEKIAEEELKKSFPNLDEGTIRKIVGDFVNDNVKNEVFIKIGVKLSIDISIAILVKIITKKIAAKIATKLMEKIAAKMATKVGSKAAGTGGAFALGTGACLEFGPFAFACGVVAATVAAVATDYAINKLDELINRDDFKVELIGYLENSKKEFYSKLMKNFENSLMSIEGELEKSLSEKVKLKDISD